MTKNELISLVLKLIQEGPQTADTIYEYLERKAVKKKLLEDEERHIRAIQRRIRTAIDAIISMGYDRESFETTGPSNRKTWHIKQADDDRYGKWLIRGILPQVFSSKRQDLLYELNSWLVPENDPIIDSTHFYETAAHNRLDDRLKMVVQAIDSGQKLRITGMTGDSTSVGSLVQFPLVILPIKIIYHRGCFYLAAVANIAHRVLTFQIDQLDMQAVNERFNRTDFIALVEADLRTRFGISQNIDREVHTIELRFSERTGAFVTNQSWHPDMETIKDGDGWRIAFPCGINRELVGWIFQWMSNVRVIGPPRLKELYDEQLRRMLTITSEPPDAPLDFSNAFEPIHHG